MRVGSAAGTAVLENRTLCETARPALWVLEGVQGSGIVGVVVVVVVGEVVVVVVVVVVGVVGVVVVVWSCSGGCVTWEHVALEDPGVICRGEIPPPYEWCAAGDGSAAGRFGGDYTFGSSSDLGAPPGTNPLPPFFLLGQKPAGWP
ncbi:unnamed protein product [Gadus morhua 'NCC']